MSILNNSLLLGADAGGYQISRSLRFNSADSAYLSRTPASAGNRKTFTFSCWIKRSKAGDFRTIFSAATDTSNLFIIRFTDADLLEIRSATGGSTVFQLITTQVFRDFSAWYHIVVAVDTTNATGGDRVRLYINGSEITVFNTDTVPTQNADSWANNNVLHEICRQANNPSNYYQDGYLADVHLIDGQQLTPSSFAETNATTGQWVPKAYTGSYGTNGFRLDFSDNSAATATTLGKDRAGSNNWTPNNLSVTAGAGNDSLVDTPTSHGTDTGAGGEVRGNYATLNPLSNSTGRYTLSDGNLKIAATDAFNAYVSSTIALPASGQFYFEYTCTNTSTSQLRDAVGFVQNSLAQTYLGNSGTLAYEGYVGTVVGVATGNYSTWGNNDVIGIAVDCSTGKVWFSKNNTWQNSGSPTGGTGQVATLTNITNWIPACGAYAGSQFNYTANGYINFGQRPFAYTAPSGFKALCDTNLPAPVVAKPSESFQTVLWTGDNTSNRTITTGLRSGFVWIKNRSATGPTHILHDVVRGAGQTLYTSSTSAEVNNGTAYVQQFNATNFLLGAPDSASNASGNSYVGWVWDPGASTVTNTSGSISSQVRANASAGFSIVTYTGNGSTGATVGHGLGVSLGMVIVKRRNAAGDHWPVWHTSLGNNAGAYLDLTNASYSSSAHVQSVTSTTFIVGTDTDANASGGTYVAYCFAPVAGYSSFGSYTGNGSTDGPFVYTGFRPRFLLMKNSNVSGQYWDILDTARDTYNASGLRLFPNASDSENDVRPSIDILSNGFKVRNNYTSTNGSTNVIIYAAFAESPLQYARAR